MESKKNLNAPKFTPKEDRRTRCRKCLLILIIKYNFRFLIFFFQILLTVLHIMMKTFKSKISNRSRFERQTHIYRCTKISLSDICQMSLKIIIAEELTGLASSCYLKKN